MMTTQEEDGCRLLPEQLVGTGAVVTTDGRTCYDVEETDYGRKFHGLNSMLAIVKCRVKTELQGSMSIRLPWVSTASFPRRRLRGA